MSKLGELWFGVGLKDNTEKQAEELKKRLEKKLSVNVEVTPYLKGDLREQITEELRGAFKIQVGIDDATRDKLRRQIKPLIDSNSPDRKFSAADLRATRAKAISEQHEEKLAALREKTRKNTANADAAEVRLTTARARAATANERLKLTQVQLNRAMEQGAKSRSLLNSSFAKIGGVVALEELARKVVTVTGDFEFMEQAIKSLVGSETQGLELMGKLREFAKISPLEVRDVTKAAQTLLGFNVELAKVPDMIQRLGDVSMGNKERFNALALAFAQTTSAARLTGEDLRQYVNAGFNPLQIIAEKTGKSMRELKDEMSKGAISVEMVEQAFIDATSAGGKFYNMSEKQSQTINGQLAKLGDSIDRVLDSIGRDNHGVITGAISTVSTLIDNYEQVGRVLVGLITTYGTYRTAVMLTTVAQNGHSLAMNIARLRILATQKAQALLNATMLSNPYVLAATALGVLVGALIASSDGMTAAERAQKNFNDAISEGAEKQREFNAETEQAISTANSDTEATGARREALNLLIDRYGDIIKKYIDEKGHLKDILQLKRELAMLDGQRNIEDLTAKARRYSDAAEAAKLLINGKPLTAQQQKLIKETKEEYFGRNSWWAKAWYSDSDLLDWAQQMAGSYDKKAHREASVNAQNRFQETIADMTDGQLKELQKTLKEAKAKKNSVVIKAYKELSDVVLTQDDIDRLITYAGGIAEARQPKSRTKKIIEDERKTAQAQLDALTVAEANGRKGAALRKKIAGYNKELEAYDTKKTNGNATRAGESAEKTAGLQIEQALKLRRSAIDIEHSTRQAEIAIMREGTEKVLAQIELDKEKRLEAIKREYEDLKIKRIEEAKKLWDADIKNKGKNFYESDAYKTAASDSQYTQAQKDNKAARMREVYVSTTRAAEKALAEQKRIMYDYLTEYGSMQDKRKAINDDYNERIARADEEWEKAKLKAERERLLSEVSLNELQLSIDWESVFSDIGSHSVKFLQYIKEQLRAALQSKDVTADTAKVLADKIMEIERTIAGKTDVWQAILPGLAERKRLTEQTAAAEMEYQKALAEEAGALMGVFADKKAIKDQLDKLDIKDAFGQRITVELETISEENKDMLLASLEKGSDLYNSLLRLFQNLAADQAVLHGKQQQTETKKSALDIQWDKLKNLNSLTDVFSWAKDGNPLSIIQGVNQNVQSLKEFVDKVGLADTGFGKAVQDFADGVNGFNNAIQALISGDVVGAVNGVLDGIAGLGKSGTRLFAGEGNTDKMEAKIDELSKANDRLAQSIESLSETIKNSDNTNSESEEAYKRALAAEKEWEQNQRKAIESRASEWSNTGHGFLGLGGKQSFNAYLNDTFKGWGDFNKVLEQYGYKTRVNSAGDIWQLTPEQMQLLRDYAPKAWAALLKTDGESNPSELINAYIERAGKIDELTSALNEKLTGYSWDAFRSSYVDILKDLTSTTENFADNIEELLTNAILNSLVNEAYKDRISALYRMIADAASDESEGGSTFTANELKAIREYNEQLASDLMAAREALITSGAIKEPTGGSSNSMSNGIKGVSEQTADLLASYINAIRADESAIRAAVTQSLTSIDSAVTRGDNSYLLANLEGIAREQLRSNVLAETQVQLLQHIADNTLRTADNTQVLGIMSEYMEEVADVLQAAQIGTRAIHVK